MNFTKEQAKEMQDRVEANRGKFLGKTAFPNAPQKPFCEVVKQKNTGLRKSEQLAHIKLVLKAMGIAYVEEYVFHPTRKWRADIAVVHLSLLIEYNGIFSTKSRHTTETGYTGDRQKVNAAQLLGFTVLEYTPLSYKEFAGDIEQLIKLKAA